jgi:hypothetical protein
VVGVDFLKLFNQYIVPYELGVQRRWPRTCNNRERVDFSARELFFDHFVENGQKVFFTFCQRSCFLYFRYGMPTTGRVPVRFAGLELLIAALEREFRALVAVNDAPEALGPETQSPEPESRNPKPSARNPDTQFRNPNPHARNLEPDTVSAGGGVHSRTRILHPTPQTIYPEP